MAKTIELHAKVRIGNEEKRVERSQFIAKSVLRGCFMNVTKKVLEANVDSYKTSFPCSQESDEYTKVVIQISGVTYSKDYASVKEAIKLMCSDERIESTEIVEVIPDSNEIRFRLVAFKEEDGKRVPLMDPSRCKTHVTKHISKVIKSVFNDKENYEISFYYDSVLGDENILVVMEVITKLKKDLERRVHILKSLKNVSRVTMATGSEIN